MEFATNVDVHGSLANPVMIVAVSLWGAALAVPLLFVFTKVRVPWQRLCLLLALLAFGCVSSPVANRAIGLLIYQVTAERNVSIGILGGPPFFASPIIATIVAAAAAAVRNWRRSETARIG